MEFFAAIPRAYAREDLPQGKFLISAARFWCPGYRRFARLKHIPQREWIIDSGAYSYPAGVPYTTRQYLDFAEQFDPVGVVAIDTYQKMTKTLARLQEDTDLLQRSGLPIWPVVTGFTLREYEKCAEMVARMYPGASRYAVGGLKRRLDIAQVVGTVQKHVHPLHLLGAVVWQVRRVLRNGWEGEAVSFDTGAWNVRFGRSLEHHRQLQKAHGMTQRRVDLEILLPKYRQRFESGVDPLFEVDSPMPARD